MTSKVFSEDISALADFLIDNGMTNASYLVTGGTGYIGRLIVKALQTANVKKIYALVRSREKAKIALENLDGINLIIGDIAESFDFDGDVDYIIHTASPTVSKYFIENPVETINSIVIGTKNVLDFAVKKKARSLVYLSSMEVYGQVGGGGRRKEDELGYINLSNVRSSYSEGKRLAELMCVSYAEEYNLNVCIARLSQVFGAGVFDHDNRVYKQFAESARNGKDIILHTDGLSYGNYTYGADAVSAIFTLLINGKKGEAYNVVNEANTMSIKDMAQLVADSFSNGKSKVVIDIPKENAGYAPHTELKLSSAKLNALGWTAKYGILEMYSRMIEYLDEMQGE